MKRWLTGKRGTRMAWWKKIAQVHACTIFIHSYIYFHSYLSFAPSGSLHCVCHVSDAVSGSASQSSSANDISSMSTEHTLASDTDSSSIDTLTGPLDESQWTETCLPQPSTTPQFKKSNCQSAISTSIYSLLSRFWFFFVLFFSL